MVRAAVLLFLLGVTPAFAQQIIPTYSLLVTEQDVAVIGEALDKEPYGKVKELIARLQAQLTKQVKERTDGKRDEK